MKINFKSLGLLILTSVVITHTFHYCGVPNGLALFAQVMVGFLWPVPVITFERLK